MKNERQQCGKKYGSEWYLYRLKIGLKFFIILKKNGNKMCKNEYIFEN